jgi:HPt (histidine-containing phosphotransfer) domain-containing protein
MSAYEKFEQHKTLWNAEQFFQICSSDEELASEFVNLYQTQFNSSFDKLQLALRSHDQQNAILFSHDIKGASLNLGCKEVSQIALELEKLARSAKLAEMEPLIPKLQNAQNKAMEILNEVLQNFPTEGFDDDDDYDDDYDDDDDE